MKIKSLWVSLLLGISLASMASANTAPAAAPEQPVAKAKNVSTADHTKFKELQRSFSSGPEVTKVCLQCHTEAAGQVMQTQHWTWEYHNKRTGQTLGKKHVINNYCTSITSNEQFCSGCHVGYGWKDKSFDFSNKENVDCLVCHDTTNTYRKLPGFAGHPLYKDTEFPKGSGNIEKAVDLKTVAQNVGKTRRENCGACHFFGGGGDAVKHGDLDSSLIEPQKYLDVHMAKDGLNFSCAECHKTSAHKVSGSRYAPTADDKTTHIRGKADSNPTTCQACHTPDPHKKGEHSARLNRHADTIACQTCHIPEFARAQVTKMSWDWSTAGKHTPEGKPVKIKDSSGHHDAYDGRKGNFTYEQSVIPHYQWFNGDMIYALPDTKLDPNAVVKINAPQGGARDGASKIWPFKAFTGQQPYDKQSQQLLNFHTYTPDKSDLDGFWGNFNWDRAIRNGMKASGRSYSGEFGFVKTVQYFPITHMVAPKGDALSCAQCHQPKVGPGRLDAIPDLYMPGRRANDWLDLVGWLAAAGTLFGVLVHGAIRIYVARKHPGEHH